MFFCVSSKLGWLPPRHVWAVVSAGVTVVTVSMLVSSRGSGPAQSRSLREGNMHILSLVVTFESKHKFGSSPSWGQKQTRRD